MKKYFFYAICAMTVLLTACEQHEPSNNDTGSGTSKNQIAFSVSAEKQVTFSKGNLQYTRSSDTWSFAENQWDMIGINNMTGGSVSSDPTYGDSKKGTALADKIDLFGGSTGTTDPNTWRTLSYDEWDYLLNTRSNASSLKGVAQVNGVNGLILLPDDWTCPAGVTYKSGFHSNYGEDYYAAYQTFTAEQWSKLEAAGAVFLPAAGYRFGWFVYCVQDHGYYWSATENDSFRAYYLDFRWNGASMGDGYRLNGLSVRLVQDLP